MLEFKKTTCSIALRKSEQSLIQGQKIMTMTCWLMVSMSGATYKQRVTPFDSPHDGKNRWTTMQRDPQIRTPRQWITLRWQAFSSHAQGVPMQSSLAHVQIFCKSQETWKARTKTEWFSTDFDHWHAKVKKLNQGWQIAGVTMNGILLTSTSGMHATASWTSKTNRIIFWACSKS